jgi:uncharacterized protein (TIGR00369 family)
MPETPDHALLPAFPTMLGIVLTMTTPELVEAEWQITEAHSNRNGVMHGGAIMTLADSLGGVAAALNLSEGQRTTTVESKTNFLRAVPLGETVRATCTALHVGRKTAVFQITVRRAEGKVAAIVTQTQLTL